MSPPDMPTTGLEGPDALQDLAGEYVLGTLDADRRRAVEARLPQDRALRQAVAYWEQRLLPLASLVEPAEPSPAVWERITHSVAEAERRAAAAGAAAAQAARPPRPRAIGRLAGWWHSLALWRGLAAAGCAAAVVLASLPALRTGAPDTPQYLVVLVAPQDKSPGWVVQARHTGSGSVELIPLGRDAVPAEKALQFWTKADDWKGPVSLGLVQPGQPVRVPLSSLPPLQANQLFELTLEPAAGSPTGRPTGPVQFIGRAVKVL